MACDIWDERLDRYLDGELPDAELPALEAHLSGCSACTAEALARRELRAAIRDAGATYSPRPAFRTRVERSLRKRPTGLWLAPLAAVLLLGLGLVVFQGLRRSDRESVLGECLDIHVAALASSSPVDVVSSDAHTVKPWFEGKIPFTFDLPELSGTPFELIGGRVAWIGQAPGAHLLFRVRKHRISVFVFQERATRARGPEVGPVSERKLSFRLLSWRDQGLDYVVVADIGAGDAEALTALLRRAARQG